MIKKHALRLLILSTLSFFLVSAQGNRVWIKHLPKKTTAYSLDSENNIFLGYANGNLQKISIDGSEPEPFSIPNQSSITLVEAQNNRKIFLFYRDIQQIMILDRFSTIPKKYDMQSFGIDYAESACISPDGTFWVAENNPQRLKKIDPLRNVVIHEVQHNLGDSISIMRTFGNQLLIADENGLQILDQFGNLNGRILMKGISYLQILNNYVYLTLPAGLVTVDPYKSKILEEVEIDLFKGKNAIMKLKNEFVVIDDENLALISLTKPKK